MDCFWGTVYINELPSCVRAQRTESSSIYLRSATSTSAGSGSLAAVKNVDNEFVKESPTTASGFDVSK